MKPTQRPIATLVLLLLLVPTARAQEGLEEVVTDSLGTLQVERDPETGTARRVYGMTTDVEEYGLPVEQATIPELSQAIFRDYAEVLGVDPDAFVVERAETDGELWFVSAAQTVDGVPVYGTEIGYTLNGRGELLALGAEAYPDIKVGTTPSVSATKALEVAQAAFGADSAEVKQEPDLVIFPEGEGEVTFHLTWKLELFSHSPLRDVVYFVDARSGQVVHEYSNLLHHSYGHGAPSDGTSTVPHAEEATPLAHGEALDAPAASITTATTGAAALATLQGTIRGTFWPAEHTDPTTTEGYLTKDIKLYNEVGQLASTFSTNSSGGFSVANVAPGVYILRIPLQSSYVQVRNGGNNVPTVDRNIVVNGSAVNYTWAVSDAANVKRHAEVMHTFFAGAPFYYSPMNYQMQAHIDERVLQNGVLVPAAAAADGTDIFFGDAGNRAWEETAEVIRHEYTHNTIYRIYGGWINNIGDPEDNLDARRARAMDEGISDYFSSTVSGDPLQGETVLPSDEVRNLDNNTLKWNASRDAYWNSQVISGALWDTRQAVQNTNKKTDRLVFRALQITPRARNFENFGYNMLIADREYNGGANESKIRTAFQNHGITIATLPPPLSPPSAPTSFNVTGNPGQRPVLSWSAVSGATGYKIYRCLSNSTSCSSFTYLTSTSSTSYTDLNRTVGSSCSSTSGEQFTYYYVKAYNSSGDSPASATKSTCTSANKQDAADLVAGAQELLPSAYALEPNYPNPFNPSTEIRFALPEGADVRLMVYDALGREVARLVDGPVAAGYQHATFEAANLPSGVYLYRLEAKGAAETFAKTGRMVLVK